MPWPAARVRAATNGRAERGPAVAVGQAGAGTAPVRVGNHCRRRGREWSRSVVVVAVVVVGWR